jgi:hypothetical protein
MLEEFLKDRPADEGRAPSKHMEECATQRIEVASDVDISRIPSLLRTNIVERSERHPTLSKPAVLLSLELTSESHIHKLGTTTRGKDDI